MGVRNVVFDFGGVLVDWRPQHIIDSFYSKPRLRAAIRTHGLQHDDWLAMDRGTLDEVTITRRIAARMRRPKGEVRRFFAHVRRALVPVEPTVALLHELKGRGYRLFGLSNMSAEIFDYLAGRHEFFKLFEGIVVSAHVRLVKPEAGIYQHLRERFALDFGESVFIDDLERNVAAARALGLAGIRFETTAQVRAELEPRLAPRPGAAAAASR